MRVKKMNSQVPQGYQQTEAGVIPDDWEVVKMADIASFFKGKGISKKDISDDGIECIRYGELYTKYDEKIQNIASKTNLPIDQLFLSKKNDILIPASGETAIDLATASCVLKDNVALGGDINIIRSMQNGIYLSYYLNTVARNRIAKLAQGVSVIHLYSSHLKTLSISLPSKPEQQKIADILTIWDKVIEKQSALITQKQQLKNGLMQQLFSQQVRFKADGSDFPDWKEEKLGEIGKISMCKRILKKETNETKGVPFYKIGTFGKKTNAFISKELYEQYVEKYSFPKKGDILISAAGTIGRIVIYDGNPGYFQDSNIVWIDNNEDVILNSFLAYCYTRVNWQTENTTIPRLYNNILREVKIPLPLKLEQAKIANLLTLADDEISKLEQELNALKSQKKGLMQKLLTGQIRVTIN
ncbi:Type I restriction-modification system, specificity subunit S [uncultured Candidatus Thioglobus sp.]|nr:Type I restriction-modification system, specificity subunit S [uncultured Candidatus Thioglobus sp.]